MVLHFGVQGMQLKILKSHKTNFTLPSPKKKKKILKMYPRHFSKTANANKQMLVMKLNVCLYSSLKSYWTCGSSIIIVKTIRKPYYFDFVTHSTNIYCPLFQEFIILIYLFSGLLPISSFPIFSRAIFTVPKCPKNETNTLKQRFSTSDTRKD